jgi:sulfite reductase beta subunit-like hemoprotein
MAKPDGSGESKVERAKREGRHLRGTIAETLGSDAASFGADDIHLLKFHGVYQQDDRDARRGRLEGEEKAYQFMVRVALPGGRLGAAQYLELDRLADRANGTLRVTTRQGFQYHGVLKGELKATIAGVHRSLATTLAACGDVNRNVMGCPAPLADPLHRSVQSAAARIAADLRPASGAYHEIWLDGERQLSTEIEEPFYGDRYLPRKFKVAVGLASDNCVDLHAHDVALVALPSGTRVAGFALLVGGGLGMTHGKGDTIASLAQPLGRVAEADAVLATRTVAAIFRDHGNRADRRHARLKYLIQDWGMDRFREEFARRAPGILRPFEPLDAITYHDHLGPARQGDGRWCYGVFIQSGRIADTGTLRLRSALRAIVTRLEPGLSLTPHQNLILTDLDRAGLALVEDTLYRHGVAPPAGLSAVQRHSMACPALPTCGLAVAESERFFPGVLAELEAELGGLGLRDAPIAVRMTGCPNGCARPYTADLAFVGRSLGLYHIYVGGGLRGDRVTDLYLADVRADDLVAAVAPLLRLWAAQRSPGEGLGDFYQRTLGRREARQRLTGRETPTAELVQLERIG